VGELMPGQINQEKEQMNLRNQISRITPGREGEKMKEGGILNGS
jgi:hypothetical protein